MHNRATVKIGNYSTLLANILSSNPRSPVSSASLTYLVVPTFILGISDNSNGSMRTLISAGTVEQHWMTVPPCASYVICCHTLFTVSIKRSYPFAL